MFLFLELNKDEDSIDNTSGIDSKRTSRRSTMSTGRRSITSEDRAAVHDQVIVTSDLEKSAGSQNNSSNGAVEGSGEEEGTEVKVRAVY